MGSVSMVKVRVRGLGERGVRGATLCGFATRTRGVCGAKDFSACMLCAPPSPAWSRLLWFLSQLGRQIVEAFVLQVDVLMGSWPPPFTVHVARSPMLPCAP